MQLVGFGINQEQFGVNILMVQEIIRSAPVTAVPNSPEFVEGVINLRGDIIPVIDLRKRLFLFREDNHERNWILILNISDRVIGFIVDRVTEVLKVAHNHVEPAPDVVIAGLENQYIQGVCDVNDNLLIILNFERILFNEEYYLLKDANYNELILGDDAVTQ
ncbi:MAG: chemotaxis protein CheW [Gammaproteobacteria bacterium]|nr:chemotaxis protein CheW [Gammaproteobacteria bacterium]MDH5800713.1 chemotaxis protein CheW [Gammaproteobacteria bacterium]